MPKKFFRFFLILFLLAVIDICNVSGSLIDVNFEASSDGGSMSIILNGTTFNKSLGALQVDVILDNDVQPLTVIRGNLPFDMFAYNINDSVVSLGFVSLSGVSANTNATLAKIMFKFLKFKDEYVFRVKIIDACDVNATKIYEFIGRSYVFKINIPNKNKQTEVVGKGDMDMEKKTSIGSDNNKVHNIYNTSGYYINKSLMTNLNEDKYIYSKNAPLTSDENMKEINVTVFKTTTAVSKSNLYNKNKTVNKDNIQNQNLTNTQVKSPGFELTLYIFAFLIVITIWRCRVR